MTRIWRDKKSGNFSRDFRKKLCPNSGGYIWNQQIAPGFLGAGGCEGEDPLGLEREAEAKTGERRGWQ